MTVTKKESETLYALKAFALVSIVMAHSCYNAIPNTVVSNLFGVFARVGVVVFFILSGFFFGAARADFGQFCRKKLRGLVIPWLTCAAVYKTANYLHHSVSFSVQEIVNYVLGNGTWLYFMTVLCCCYILAQIRGGYICYIWMAVTAISTLFTACGVLSTDVFSDKWPWEYCNPYLNVLNWMGYFSLGQVVAKKKLLPEIIKWVRTHRIEIVLGTAIVSLGYAVSGIKISYWSYLSIPSALVWAAMLLLIADTIPRKCILMLQGVGKNTLFIYFYHMLIISKILRGPMLDGNVAAVLRPLIAIAVCYVVLLAGEKIALYLHVNKLFYIFTGVRRTN